MHKVRRGELDIPYGEPRHLAFLIDPWLNVYSNYGGPTDPWWRLGSLEAHSLSEILEAFENDTPPGLWATYHVPILEMADRYGRRKGTRYYVPEDLRSRWVNLWCREHFPEMVCSE